MKTLITGIDGFIGGWLADLLVERGDRVSGVTRRAQRSESRDIQRVHADLRDGAAVSLAIEQVKPDRVFHLAALNHIATSIADPLTTFQVNLLGTLHVLNAVRTHVPDAVVVSVGSSAEYGDATRTRAAVAEDDPLLPTSPYGVSKVAQGLLCRQAWRTHGVRAVHVRPFAIIGPGKRGDALSQFAEQVLRVERGEAPVVRVGSLDRVRDFVDVRDCVAALALVAVEGRPGATYNICNGDPVTIMDLVEALRKSARGSFEVVEQQAQVRAVDDVRIVGDPRKLVELGYARRYGLTDTVRDTLDTLRAQARESSP
jgi:GDP-4-dehydro-6-deoxy-D-mannose reductase